LGFAGTMTRSGYRGHNPGSVSLLNVGDRARFAARWRRRLRDDPTTPVPTMASPSSRREALTPGCYSRDVGMVCLSKCTKQKAPVRNWMLSASLRR
jgi:hypothetical protein